jgi:hypothetical protein
MFISRPRAIITAVLSLLLVFYALNFTPRAIMILATRSFVVQVLDYIVNFLLFFVVIYLVATLAAFIIRSFRPKSKA